eukprot:TRINITY_DN10713_c0_g1_i1.p1 TRINITY_DN10713_c0_g1~~TRINITY_DN10713_c0_g1_i1.p1  ORF type:complete len:115 (-),score=32.32 TRINITY_DN10713_c0_g1_i1:29-373(-)
MDTNIDELNEPNYDDEIVSINSRNEKNDDNEMPNKIKVTRPVLTKYEIARLIGARANQIALGAPPVVDVENLTDPMDIAEKELSLFKIPIIVRRYLPDNSFEDWTMSDFANYKN